MSLTTKWKNIHIYIIMKKEILEWRKKTEMSATIGNIIRISRWSWWIIGASTYDEDSNSYSECSFCNQIFSIDHFYLMSYSVPITKFAAIACKIDVYDFYLNNDQLTNFLSYIQMTIYNLISM